MTTFFKQYRLAGIALIVALLLMAPLSLTLMNPSASIYGGPGGGFDWMPSDFAVAGVLLFAAAALADLAWRKAGKYRALAALGVLALFGWLWAELAVGIFTNWGS